MKRLRTLSLAATEVYLDLQCDRWSAHAALLFSCLADWPSSDGWTRACGCRRLPNLLAWHTAARPDVVCLQELKADQDAFPIDAIRAAGYGAIWRGERAWNGVAILARDAEPIMIATRFLAIMMTNRANISRRPSAGS